MSAPTKFPRYGTSEQIRDAAEAFVASIGAENAVCLRKNLSLTAVRSDALRALRAALDKAAA